MGAEERLRSRSLRVWLVESPSYFFSVSISTSLVQPMAIRFMGADVASLGILVLVQLGSTGLGAVLGVSVINAYRARRKLLWLLFGAVNRLGWAGTIFTVLMPPPIGIYALYTAVGLAQASGSIAGIAAGDVGADLVPRERAARYFSRLNSLNNLASLLSLAAVSAIFSRYQDLGEIDRGYWASYSTSLASAAFSTAALYMIRDSPSSVQEIRGSGSRGVLSIYTEILGSGEARTYISMVTLYTAFTNLPAALWNYYLIENIGGDEVWITLKAATNYVAKSLSIHIWPLMFRMAGLRKTFSAALYGISPIPLLFMISRNLPSQLAMEAYSGFWWSCWDLGTGIYNLYMLPRGSRHVALSLITLTSNVAAALASFAGSELSSRALIGYEALFVASSLGRAAAALALSKKLPDLRI